MSRLTLIAHAETDATRRAAFALDEPLTQAGRDAAERVASRSSAAVPAGSALTAPARAALETAAALRLAAVVEPELRDLDVGRWRGRSFAEVAAAEPAAAAAFLADPGFHGHGGESIDTLASRVSGWLGTSRDAGSSIAVTHAAVVRAAVLAALRAPASAFFRIDVAPLDRAVLSGDGRRWALRLQPPRSR